MSPDVELLILLVVVGLLTIVVRWVFKPSRPRTGLPVDAADSAELGMLVVVAARVTRSEAMNLRATLGEEGIRSSMSRRRDGNMDVLVFYADAARARELLR